MIHELLGDTGQARGTRINRETSSGSVTRPCFEKHLVASRTMHGTSRRTCTENTEEQRDKRSEVKRAYLNVPYGYYVIGMYRSASNVLNLSIAVTIGTLLEV